jgi:hypothetical protein
MPTKSISSELSIYHLARYVTIHAIQTITTNAVTTALNVFMFHLLAEIDGVSRASRGLACLACLGWLARWALVFVFFVVFYVAIARFKLRQLALIERLILFAEGWPNNHTQPRDPVPIRINCAWSVGTNHSARHCLFPWMRG